MVVIIITIRISAQCSLPQFSSAIEGMLNNHWTPAKRDFLCESRNRHNPPALPELEADARLSSSAG